MAEMSSCTKTVKNNTLANSKINLLINEFTWHLS